MTKKELRRQAEKLFETNLKDYFSWTQIKEKFGQLRLYYSGGGKHVEAWASKYEELSEKTCIHCGKPAKYMSIGWISPWCEDCAKEINDTVVKIEDVEDFYNALPEERKKFIVKF